MAFSEELQQRGKCKWLVSWRADLIDEHKTVLMAIFIGEPVLAGFIEAKDDGGGGDNWSYETFRAPVKLSPLIIIVC